MNNTIAIKADRELLERARIDLVSAGFTDDLEWNNLQQMTSAIKYLFIGKYNLISLTSSMRYGQLIWHMTESNYTEVINELKQRPCTHLISR